MSWAFLLFACQQKDRIFVARRSDVQFPVMLERNQTLFLDRSCPWLDEAFEFALPLCSVKLCQMVTISPVVLEKLAAEAAGKLWPVPLFAFMKGLLVKCQCFCALILLTTDLTGMVEPTAFEACVA